MPVFVFLSGYFTNTKKDAKGYFHDVLNLLLVYVIFQILKWLCFSREFSVNALLAPQWTWWYLLGLTYWRVMYYALRRCSAWTMLGLGVALSLVGGLVPVGTILTIQRFFAHGAFFAFGYFVKEKDLLGKIYALPGWVALAIAAVFVAAQVYFRSTDINFVLWGRDQYAAWPIDLVWCAPVRALWLMLSTGVIVLFLKFSPSSEFLQKIGVNTLFLYAYHSFVLNIFKVMSPSLPEVLTGKGISVLGADLILLLVEALSVMVVMALLNRIKVLHKVLSPLDLGR